MAKYLKHQSANLALMNFKLPVVIAKFYGTWRHSESYNSVLERPGALILPVSVVWGVCCTLRLSRNNDIYLE